MGEAKPPPLEEPSLLGDDCFEESFSSPSYLRGRSCQRRSLPLAAGDGKAGKAEFQSCRLAGSACSPCGEYGGGEEHSSSLHLHARFQSPQLPEEEHRWPPCKAGRARCSDGKAGKGVTNEFPALRAGNNSTSPPDTAAKPLCHSAPERAKKFIPARKMCSRTIIYYYPLGVGSGNVLCFLPGGGAPGRKCRTFREP